MAELLGGVTVAAHIEGVHTTNYSWRDDTAIIIGRHYRGEENVTVRMDGLHLPERRRIWAALQLYSFRAGQRFGDLSFVVMDAAGDVAQPSPSVDFRYSAPEDRLPYSLRDALQGLATTIFHGDEGARAIADIVGATDLAAFQEAWRGGAEEDSPLSAARFLLDQAETYYQP